MDTYFAVCWVGVLFWAVSLVSGEELNFDELSAWETLSGPSLTNTWWNSLYSSHTGLLSSPEGWNYEDLLPVRVIKITKYVPIPVEHRENHHVESQNSKSYQDSYLPPSHEDRLLPPPSYGPPAYQPKIQSQNSDHSVISESIRPPPPPQKPRHQPGPGQSSAPRYDITEAIFHHVPPESTSKSQSHHHE